MLEDCTNFSFINPKLTEALDSSIHWMLPALVSVSGYFSGTCQNKFGSASVNEFTDLKAANVLNINVNCTKTALSIDCSIKLIGSFAVYSPRAILLENLMIFVLFHNTLFSATQKTDLLYKLRPCAYWPIRAVEITLQHQSTMVSIPVHL